MKNLQTHETLRNIRSISLAMLLGIASFGLVIAVSGAMSSARAAFITTQEAGLDSVFSQAVFGTNPIDIRIGATTTIFAPDLLDITASGEVTTLFGLHTGGATVVNFYFIDTISACGATNTDAIVGCGSLNGNDFVVESSFAAGANGAELLAHELGHNLGLPHRDGDVLMDPFINGFTLLNSIEKDTIFASLLVKSDTNGFFIDINPVLITATVIPLPAALPLFGAGLAGLGFLARRKKQAA